MSISRWSEAKLFKFLRLYKRYECLWNPYSPEYENRSIKSTAFSQILYEMNEFGLTVDKCLSEIKYIRDTYKRERKRLQSLADSGGRGYSKLLWYPLMNSMLSKIIKDEERVNAAAVGDHSALVAVTKHSSFDAGDQFDQRIIPWNRLNGDMTMCAYLPDSSHGDYSYPDDYSSPNCSNSFEGVNEHIRSCPTCGFSKNSSYNCFSIDQISYRPRTSRNYRNGILEINSGVRVSESHQSSTPNRRYDMPMMKSVIPEESGNQSDKSFDVVQHGVLAVCDDCEEENCVDEKAKVEQESTAEVSVEKERIKKNKYSTQRQLTLRKLKKKNKLNLTEMVLDLILNTLNKPCGTKRRSQEISIAKKVIKVLQAILNEQINKCNDNKSAIEHSGRKTPSGSKPLNEMICWCGQPIEEISDMILHRTNCTSTNDENIIPASSQVESQEHPDVISVDSASETINSVVTKVTDFLDETLHQKGFLIKRESFIEQNGLIVNRDDYMEINQKLTKNEVEWKTDLKNIVNNLIRHKKADDPIRFKIRTMVLPAVPNGTNEGRVQLCTITRPPMQNVEPEDNQIGETEMLKETKDDVVITTSAASCQCEPFRVDEKISANFEAAADSNHSHDHLEPAEKQRSTVENNIAESNLLHVTNPAMFEKLSDTIKGSVERIQNQDCCSSIEVQTKSRADSGNSEILSDENGIDECQDNTEQESLSASSEITKCQRPCGPLPVEFDGNNYSENYTKIITEAKNEIPQSGETPEDVKLKVVSSEEISSGSQTQHLSAEKLCYQDISCPMHSTDCLNFLASDADLQSKIHSNDEICCANDSCNSSTTNKASLVVISQSPRDDENDHYSQEESEVDVDTFVNTVAAQLRELPTEAALRSQQRIQTLITNSRLESGRNMQHR